MQHKHIRSVRPTNQLSLITVRDAEIYIGLAENVDSGTVTDVINSAIDMVSNDTKQAVLESTYKLYLPYFEDSTITLPFLPLRGITSVQYYDSANTLQSLTEDVDFYMNVSGEQEFGGIEVIEDWPDTYSRNDAVIITYTAGYDVEQVPYTLRSAALIKAGELYMDRTGYVTNMEKTRSYDDLINVMRIETV